jgi:predicted dehydrogenase
MRRNIRVGVIGLGRAGWHHAQVYHKLPMIELAAVCDKNQQLLDRFVKTYPVAKTYTDYRELLMDKDIDAVSIVMPDTMHLEATEMAIDYDKHVLLEKPIASTMSDAHQIVRKAQQTSKVFMIAHIVRYMPQYALGHDAVVRGDIGSITYISTRRNSTVPGAAAYSSHNTDTQIHLMIHDIDYINWVVRSKPIKVYAKSRQVVLKPYNIRDVITAVVEYENGVIANLESCWSLPGSSPIELDDRIEIIGTDGVMYIDGICNGLKVVGKQGTMQPDTVAWPQVNGYCGGALFEEITAFINYIVHGQKPLVGASEGYEALLVADAIDRSICEGKEILIQEDSSR